MCQAPIPAQIQNSCDEHNLETIRDRAHTHCVVCSPGNPAGLKVHFEVSDGGAVEGHFSPNHLLQGYNGLVHGGVIASLLDGAMTNCLFAHGIEALTAELVVRYKKPVIVTEKIGLRAWIEQRSSLLYCMRAELSQNGSVKAAARAKFLNKP